MVNDKTTLENVAQLEEELEAEHISLGEQANFKASPASQKQSGFQAGKGDGYKVSSQTRWNQLDAAKEQKTRTP